jgi:hypothetical protein
MFRRLDLSWIVVFLIGVFMRILMAVTQLFLPWSLMIPTRLVLLTLLRLKTPLLICFLVKCRDEVLEGPYKVNAEIPLWFVGLFDRFGDILDGCGEAFERGVDALEACGDAFEEFGLLVVF